MSVCWQALKIPHHLCLVLWEYKAHVVDTQFSADPRSLPPQNSVIYIDLYPLKLHHSDIFIMKALTSALLLEIGLEMHED